MPLLTSGMVSPARAGANLEMQIMNFDKPQRIMYALGPGDVVGLYRDLLEGKTPSVQMQMDFSTQFLDWCDETGVEAHLISSHSRRDRLQVGRHKLENLPRPSLYFRGGAKHHLGLLLYGLAIVSRAVRERASLVIADSGTTHWIVLSLLGLAGIPVIAVMHNSLWPMGYPPQRRIDRLLLWLDGVFFRRTAGATACVSPECARQVRTVARTPRGPVLQFRPQVREGLLAHVSPPPPHAVPPFRVLFLGRIEEYKGIFMILSMAERLEMEFPGRFAWKIVGGGGALDALRKQAAERKLTQVEITGRLPNEPTMEALGWAHVMVVPTTSGFCEGLAMTAGEAILVGRPVVVSTVVPAWEILGGAAIVAQAEDLDSFLDVFRRLLEDAAFYEQCQRETASAQLQFYDRSQGLGPVLGRAIASLD